MLIISHWGFRGLLNQLCSTLLCLFSDCMFCHFYLHASHLLLLLISYVNAYESFSSVLQYEKLLLNYVLGFIKNEPISVLLYVFLSYKEL